MFKLGALSFVLGLFLLGCAPANFSPQSADVTVNASSQGGDGDLLATGTPTPQPTPTPGPYVYPKITMKIPTCQANSTCRVEVVLDRSDSRSISFEWATNDNKWQENPGVYAQPNVHYVPTGGIVQFNPGSVGESLSIQSLSGFTTIRIPFKWWNCRYNGEIVDCGIFQISLLGI